MKMQTRTVNGRARGLLAGVVMAVLAGIGSIAVPQGARAAGAHPYAGWYASDGSWSGTDVVIHWWTSYVYPYSGTDPLYWEVNVTYVNTSQHDITLTCNGWGDPSVIQENMSGTGNAGIVSADSTLCSRNPGYTQTLGPNQRSRSWAIFHNVPWSGGTVAIRWGGYGWSASVNPYGRSLQGSPPPEQP